MILIDFISHVSCGCNQIIGMNQFNGGKLYFDSGLESIVCHGEDGRPRGSVSVCGSSNMKLLAHIWVAQEIVKEGFRCQQTFSFSPLKYLFLLF